MVVQCTYPNHVRSDCNKLFFRNFPFEFLQHFFYERRRIFYNVFYTAFYCFVCFCNFCAYEPYLEGEHLIGCQAFHVRCLVFSGFSTNCGYVDFACFLCFLNLFYYISVHYKFVHFGKDCLFVQCFLSIFVECVNFRFIQEAY